MLTGLGALIGDNCMNRVIGRTLAIRFVLVETSHPGNIGAAARAMKAMGIPRLCLVRPQRFPDAEATARAAGADDLLASAVVVDSLAQALADCGFVVGTSARARHIEWPMMDPPSFALQVLDHARGSEVAVVFGRENSGLSNEELDKCHALLRIPTADSFASLNLAAAVQVVAYELRRAALANVDSGVDPPTDHLVSQSEMEGFYEHLEQTLIDIDYFDPDTPKLLRRRLRRIFNRIQPDRPELNILRGILTAAQRAARRD